MLGKDTKKFLPLFSGNLERNYLPRLMEKWTGESSDAGEEMHCNRVNTLLFFGL